MASTTQPRLEVPIFGPDDGPLAVSLGASRLELNRAGSYALGGTTPTLAELTALLSSLATSDLPRPTIRIMIRPRGPPPPSPEPSPGPVSGPEPTSQDFLYTPAEHAAMAASVRAFAASGLLSPRRGDGFVFGALRRRPGTGVPELDVERNAELVRLAESSGVDGGGVRLACVLHRAVDEILLPAGAAAAAAGGPGGVAEVMGRVGECGFDGVLTSGGRGDAVRNVEGLRGVVRTGAGVAGTGVEVIVGGGVRRGNLRVLVEGLMEGGGDGVLGDGVWFHSSCLGAEGRFDEEEARGLADGLRELKVVLPCVRDG